MELLKFYKGISVQQQYLYLRIAELNLDCGEQHRAIVLQGQLINIRQVRRTRNSNVPRHDSNATIRIPYKSAAIK